ncbi:DIS3-like exonuclease 2 [Plodia interpunctella]|uniref:DIS3-like exonuclease 2 n=1 Tax=Plodia interpunctella TaxID=58824 RepID=UPI002368B5C3|nr:DIS3-like exonuclease 2 [Plodia interpunctella]
MSTVPEVLSDSNVAVTGPSTSTSQVLPLTSSVFNDNQQAVTNASKHLSSSELSSHEVDDVTNNHTPTQGLTNSTATDISAQCKRLSLNEVNESNSPGKIPGPKKKNAKKKEKLKQLQMPPTQNTQHQQVEFLTSAVQEFFKSQVSPLYAPTCSRYLENMCHHPQYKYTNSPVQLAGSVPTTPLSHWAQISASGSVPNSPYVAREPITPRYIQNALQHPLLSQSFSESRDNSFQYDLAKQNVLRNVLPMQNVNLKNIQTEGGTKKSPKHKNKKKEQSKEEDKKFDSYLSINEVEFGLKKASFVEGFIRINPKQFQHAYVSSTDRSEQDVLIDGLKHRNRALEGDLVVVQILDDVPSNNGQDMQKRGKVVYIKEKVHRRTCIGHLKLMADRNRQKALFVPRDHRMPRLNIPFTSWPDNFYKEHRSYENTLFLAKIIDWSDTRFALGKIICNIGQSGDMVSETKAILAQNDLDITPFGPEIRHLFPRLDYVIPEEELKIREDCRSLCIFSIDPSNCRDIDDAVSCCKLENGNYEIGVHISDVAHFLTENTILDEKVAMKATTIYLVEKAYHMLPDELCMLCSLFPGVDKLAFSVFWEITENAEVLRHRFSKTVIHSCCQLAYDHAQAILEDRQDSEDTFPETYNGYKYDDIYKSIKILGKISSILRRNRFNSGALRIDQPKVTFHLNAVNGLPENFWIYDSKESHQLIEEFMLLANMTVAKRIKDDHPDLAFLRCHPPPSLYMMKQLAKALKPMGINLDITSAGDLHRSLLPYVGPDSSDKGRAMVLNMLCAKPMTRAKYFCAHGCDDDDFHHYALNVPLYTHFTSPIRRYADIMVHRLLAASLNYRAVPAWEVDKVRMVAAQCNKQKYNAKKAGEMSTELYTLKYIEMNSPYTTEAVVVEIRDKYIDVIIVAMGLNRRLFFNNDFPGVYECIKNDAGSKLSKMQLTWKATESSPEIKQLIEVFSILHVELYRDDDMVKVEIKLVRPQ